jgi:hypothetical protein
MGNMMMMMTFLRRFVVIWTSTEPSRCIKFSVNPGPGRTPDRVWYTAMHFPQLNLVCGHFTPTRTTPVTLFPINP